MNSRNIVISLILTPAAALAAGVGIDSVVLHPDGSLASATVAGSSYAGGTASLTAEGSSGDQFAGFPYVAGTSVPAGTTPHPGPAVHDNNVLTGEAGSLDLGQGVLLLRSDAGNFTDTDADPDFFVFEDGGNDDVQVQALLADGSLGEAVSLSGWSTVRNDGTLVTNGLSGRSIDGVAFDFTDLKDASGSNLEPGTPISGIMIGDLNAADFYEVYANVEPAAGANLIENPGFEATPYDLGWSGTSSANTGTPMAETTSASAASIHQDFAPTDADALSDFRVDLQFRLESLNQTQRIRLRDDANAGDFITLRIGASGIDRFSGSWAQALAYPVASGTIYHLRIQGSDTLGGGSGVGSYTIGLSTDGVNFTTSAAISGFHGSGSGLNFETIRLESSSGGATWDDISVVDTRVPVEPPAPEKVVEISGVYPHLAVSSSHLEVGIGAVVPWADRLWAITYGPHIPNGDSTNKLYEIDDQLTRITRPESLGGTPANRFIHEPSNQLIIGPHFIDASRNVRNLPYSAAPGRHTATTAHLTDPDNRIYMFTMEDGVYDVNVNDLSFITRYPDVQGTGDKFLFGYHGKGAFTGQGHLIVANNGRPRGQGTPLGPSGALARWDGTTYADNGNSYLSLPAINSNTTYEHNSGPVAGQPDYIAGWTQDFTVQHCEVTGPGGIRGNQNPATDPVWATGFDAKSVVLRVFEGGTWNTWRLPKASYSHDGSHGWHTEWPRIRQLDPSTPGSPYLMHMHGLFFDFPPTFSPTDFSGLAPICGYYKMPVDYCMFDGRLVMAKNDASKFDNALALRAQSNFWFGQLEDLNQWGAPSGHGSVWLNEAVANGDTSEPFLINGFSQRTLHLRNTGAAAVDIEVQTSPGDGTWTTQSTVNVPPGGYHYELISDLPGEWVRLVASGSSTSFTAFIHMSNPYPHASVASIGTDRFAALADIRDTTTPHSDGILRVMADDSLRLEFASDSGYHRIGGAMELEDVSNSAAEADLRADGALNKEFGSDAASAWIDDGGTRYRLPMLDPLYDSPFLAGWARGEREVVTERKLFNLHGTFYEVPRDNSGGKRLMRPLATHGKRITDFTSWRGLLVLSGVLDDAPASDSLVRSPSGAGLWLGEVDDIWRMGEPRGKGGPWKDTAVTANTPSNPYLMYGYDRKELTLSVTDAATITVQVDFLADETWSTYQTFSLAAGETLNHLFPAGFHAHWVRVISDTNTTATAQFTYGPADQRDTFIDWARENGLPTAGGRAALAAANGDDDNLSDLAEFVFGTDPTTPNSWPLSIDLSGMKVVLRDRSPTGGIGVDFESCVDLLSWLPDNEHAVPAADQSDVPSGFTRWIFAFDPASEPRRFVRIVAAMSALLSS